MAMCGTFGNYAIVPEISLVKIDDDVDLRYAALIGCGVLTGVGAALNTANIRQGDTVAVVGCGGVGLNVIQGAKIAGAEKIIAVDMFESKLKMAEQFGATDLVKADEGDAVTNVIELTGGRGADVAFEVIGLGPTIEQTINMTRNGGEAILVGVPRMDVMLNLNAAFTFLYLAKTVKGCWYGSSQRPRGRAQADRALQGRQAQARGARLARDRRRRRERGLHRDAAGRGRPEPHHPRPLTRRPQRPVLATLARSPAPPPAASRDGRLTAADPLATPTRGLRLGRRWRPGRDARSPAGGPAGASSCSRWPSRCSASTGFHPTSMNDVAEAAGVTKPVLYQHFRSKRELYREVLTDVGAHLLDAITKATAAAQSPHEQVELGFIAYFRFVEANEAAFRVLFGGGTRRDEEFAAQVAERRGGHRRGHRRPHRRRGAHRSTSGASSPTASSAWPRAPSRLWMAEGAEEPAEDVARLVADLAWRGLRGIRGV